MFDLPEVPLAVLAIINLLAPLAIGLINSPKWAPKYKRLVSVAVSVLLSLFALAIFYAQGEPLPNWPTLILLGILVSQTSYTLLLKAPSTQIEKEYGVQ